MTRFSRIKLWRKLDEIIELELKNYDLNPSKASSTIQSTLEHIRKTAKLEYIPKALRVPDWNSGEVPTIHDLEFLIDVTGYRITVEDVRQYGLTNEFTQEPSLLSELFTAIHEIDYSEREQLSYDEALLNILRIIKANNPRFRAKAKISITSIDKLLTEKAWRKLDLPKKQFTSLLFRIYPGLSKVPRIHKSYGRIINQRIIKGLVSCALIVSLSYAGLHYLPRVMTSNQPIWSNELKSNGYYNDNTKVDWPIELTRDFVRKLDGYLQEDWEKYKKETIVDDMDYETWREVKLLNLLKLMNYNGEHKSMSV